MRNDKEWVIPLIYTVKKKLIKIEKEISMEKGPFNIFALFLREDEDKWDLLISSEWADSDYYDSLKYIGSKIQRELTPEEIIIISGIQIISSDNPELKKINNFVKREDSINIDHDDYVELNNHNFFGFSIKIAYIIRQNKELLRLKK